MINVSGHLMPQRSLKWPKTLITQGLSSRLGTG
jgi:hypothetical protein